MQLFSRFFFSIFLCLLLFFASCVRPEDNFDAYRPAPAPDYSKESSWAALPTKKDSADAVPPGSGLKDEQAMTSVDVFFIHPTSYYKSNSWNADMNDQSLNKRTDETTILHQASVFNGAGKVYAPRYRQATLYSFFDKNGDGRKAIDFAYGDVKIAFRYYLDHYNHGRPFVLASHSQGTYHAIRLMKELFDNDTALQRQLVAAYLIGGPVTKNFLKNIPPCDSASQCGCYVAWNARKWKEMAYSTGSKNMFDSHAEEVLSLECVNPLTWKRDTVYSPASLNHGSVPVGFKRVDANIADAKCTPQGTLWVRDPHKSGYPNVVTYHILDYGLFWINIRENVKLRVDKYLQMQ